MKNPVHAALCLIMTLFGVAVAFVAQSADFLAAVQIIVYAGAIVVLFLFVIMFLGVDRDEHSRTSSRSSVSGPSPRSASRSPSAGLIALMAALALGHRRDVGHRRSSSKAATAT